VRIPNGRSGLVVTISSTAGVVGGEFLYDASKFGVEGWMESVVRSLRQSRYSCQ
jgi:short-subunit dehydrogenase